MTTCDEDQSMLISFGENSIREYDVTDDPDVNADKYSSTSYPDKGVLKKRSIKQYKTHQEGELCRLDTEYQIVNIVEYGICIPVRAKLIRAIKSGVRPKCIDGQFAVQGKSDSLIPIWGIFEYS